MRKQVAGVTLIELMIVVVIIGILGTVAIPAYRSYSVRAQRAEAQTLITRVAAAQERYYLSNNTYCPDGNLEDPMPRGLGIERVSNSGNYVVNIVQADANGFQVAATAQGGQANDDAECALFGVNERGVKYGGPGPVSPGSNNPKCWGN